MEATEHYLQGIRLSTEKQPRNYKTWTARRVQWSDRVQDKHAKLLVNWFTNQFTIYKYTNQKMKCV